MKTSTEFDDPPDAARKLVEAAAGAEPCRAVIVATSAADGAPDKVVEIAEAATRAAAIIAGDLTQKNPNAAAAIAVAVSNISKSSAPAIVASVTRSLSPAQKNQVAAVVVTAVPEKRAQMQQTVQQSNGNTGNPPAGQAPAPGSPTADRTADGSGNTAGGVPEGLLNQMIAGDPSVAADVRAYLAAGADEDIVVQAKDLIVQIGARKSQIGTD